MSTVVNRSSEDVAPAKARDAAVVSSGRLLSLDVFRGITIAAMILVNNPGTWDHVYAPFEHATWHGWTPTDLIFPCFIFMVGVAMTFSFAKAIEQGAGPRELLLKTLKRALSIVAVGLVLHAFVAWGFGYAHLRIPGVLQRIGIVYFCAAAIYLYTGVRGQIAASIALLLGYWALETLVPVPGGSAGVLEPSKDLGAFIDRAVFTEDHLWPRSRTWDPEGLLGTLPAIVTALLGALAGAWLRSDRAPSDKVAGLFVVGGAGIVLGLIWNAWFPINKNLWTGSFVLLTAGLACQFLATCYYLVDIKGQRAWAKPFIIFGSNAIAAYFFSSLMSVAMEATQVGPQAVALKTAILERIYLPWFAPSDASLLYAMTYVLLWLAAMTVLYKKRIFIKL